MLEKLAIARVLMKNPDVLILDDCMANINPFAQMAFITDFVGIAGWRSFVIFQKCKNY